MARAQSLAPAQDDSGAGAQTVGVEVVCRAVDDSYSVQPESCIHIWNPRGLLNSSWGKRNVRVFKENDYEAPSGAERVWWKKELPTSNACSRCLGRANRPSRFGSKGQFEPCTSLPIAGGFILANHASHRRKSRYAYMAAWLQETPHEWPQYPCSHPDGTGSSPPAEVSSGPDRAGWDEGFGCEGEWMWMRACMSNLKMEVVDCYCCVCLQARMLPDVNVPNFNNITIGILDPSLAVGWTNWFDPCAESRSLDLIPDNPGHEREAAGSVFSWLRPTLNPRQGKVLVRIPRPLAC